MSDVIPVQFTDLDKVLCDIASKVPPPQPPPEPTIEPPAEPNPNEILPQLPPSESPQQAQQAPQEPASYRPYYAVDSRFSEPSYELKQETPAHRHICDLFAQGLTRNEVAEKTGYSPVTVAYIRKQPWAMEQIAEMQRAAGYESVVHELKGAALDAARTLVAIAKPESKEKANDRIKAAQLLLDRLYPVAQVQLHGKLDPKEMSDEEILQRMQSSSTASNS